MTDVFIVSAARTPIGKYGGALKSFSAVDLTVPVMQAVIERIHFNPAEIDDIIWGSCMQRTKDEQNLARVASVKAGFPVEIPATTVNRTCTSSMSALVSGVQAIRSGDADVILVGGTESMSNVPYTIDSMRWGARMQHVECRDALWDGLTQLGVGPSMGITAENLAEQYDISRESQDEIAMLSNTRAAKAIEGGRFRDEIIPLQAGDKLVENDEQPRGDTTMERLARLKPIFKKDGTVTAANSSGINDGSAGLLLVSEKKLKSLNLTPLARYVAYGVAGVPPEIMGIGPVPATHKALSKAGMSLDEIDLFEINEAFAAQYLAVEKELELDRSKTNVNGSGIGLGHPVGATGVRIIISLLYEMDRRNLRYGLASLCSGGGMGMTTIIER
ncbi:thiolase family protein [uncultured Desulfosarcina sp.]|uniref:thiolase family protein n=1 Tax=uncultured Desulfosarcina sp. TaxID=218289 RepID=UPI0029C76DC1|nr:thiolase family protein [uncultured Desulfosarcina sp.]